MFGPFFVEGAPRYEHGEDISNGAPGEPCYVSGQVRGADGSVVAGALINVWQADEDGLYDVQLNGADVAHEHRARAHLHSGDDGRFHFRSILAHAYPIPHDGPVGRMLQALAATRGVPRTCIS